MKTNKTVFDYIEKAIENETLKLLIHRQFCNDEWGVMISEFKPDFKMNAFDKNVANIFLCRDYSLKYMYGDCLSIIDEINTIENELDIDSQCHLALLGFAYHTFGITLGYMGKKNDSRYNAFLEGAHNIYNQLNANLDIADLTIQEIDLDFYYDPPLGIPGLIKKYENIEKELWQEKGIKFRIGVLCLLGFMKSDNPSLLNGAVKNLKEYLAAADKNHYMHYWASCALIIAQKANNEALTQLPSTPPGARSKAERFPITLFLLLRSFRIVGDYKKTKRLLLGIERKLKNLIKYFENSDYKKFIFLSHGLVIEEWMLSVFEDTEATIKEKFYHIIHVNEIIQNRLLADKLSSYLTKDDGLINIKEMLHKIAKDRPDTGLVYITSTIRNIKNQNQFIILYAEKIGDKDTYSINTINSNSLFEIENKFIEKFIIDPGSSKKEQDRVLDLYGETLFTDNDFLNSKNTLVVPNNFCLTLPVHMARIDGEYLYEKSEFRYLPTLHIVNSKNKKSVDKNSVMTIFYTSKDENAAIEADAINESLPNCTIRLVKDPDLKTIKENLYGSNIVHTIAHGSDGNIIFNGYVIDGFDYCDAFPNDLETVSFSVCRSGAVLQKEAYPVEHVSWSHNLLKRRVKKVLTHSWDLGQHASNSFILNYYSNYNERYIAMKQYRPSEYGGYMIWGK